MGLRSALAVVMAVVVAGTAAPALARSDVAVQSRDSYRFFKQGADRTTPGAYWNPCGVIDYGIDFGYARKAGLRKTWELQRWKSVIAEYESAMGMRFRYVGQVKTHSSGTRPAGGPEMVITFGNDNSSGTYGYRKVLRGSVAGVAGILWTTAPGSNRAEVRRGYVVIDADDVRDKVGAQRPDPRPAIERGQDIVRALYMHEFGHAVGLEHVSDRRQLMYPQLVQGRPDAFGPGDSAGLRALGRQRCF